MPVDLDTLCVRHRNLLRPGVSIPEGCIQGDLAELLLECQELREKVDALIGAADLRTRICVEKDAKIADLQRQLEHYRGLAQ